MHGFTARQKIQAQVIGSLAAGLVAVATLVSVQAQGRGTHWVGTWATAAISSQQVVVLPPILRGPAPGAPPAAAPATPPLPPIQSISGQTVRDITHISIGGSRYRVVLTNQFGTAPLAVGGASIALAGRESAIVPGSAKPLLFAGKPSTTIPAGAVMVSDPVDFSAPAFADLTVDVYVSGDTGSSPLTMHTNALQTNYLSQPGNHTGKAEFPTLRTTTSSYLLSRIEVVAPVSVGAVVTFGDSITDGNASTLSANRRWPDNFARRLAANGPTGLVNLGISGNRLLSDGLGISALARFDRDVSSQSGITHMVLLEGINDIGFAGEDATPSVADLIAAHQQLIERAHARGLKVMGATLTPFQGARYYTLVGEAKRQEFNRWVRTSGAHDGFVDFDAAVRDGSDPKKIAAPFDPGDHLHFTDAGYVKMADSVDLTFFRSPMPVTALGAR